MFVKEKNSKVAILIPLFLSDSAKDTVYIYIKYNSNVFMYVKNNKEISF